VAKYISPVAFRFADYGRLDRPIEAAIEDLS
jgi:hypothetical protein